MSIEPQRTCPNCGNELPGAMEFCPVCMLRGALPGAAKSGASFGCEDTVKPTSDQPAQRLDHYELVTGEDGKAVELGRGAMGVTYQAFDIELRLPVTLKVISEKYVGDESVRLRFLREARAAAKVRHTNVASVLQVQRLASEMLDLSTRHNFAFFRSGAAILRGWAQSALGNTTQGVLSIEHGVEAWRGNGICGLQELFSPIIHLTVVNSSLYWSPRLL